MCSQVPVEEVVGSAAAEPMPVTARLGRQRVSLVHIAQAYVAARLLWCHNLGLAMLLSRVLAV